MADSVIDVLIRADNQATRAFRLASASARRMRENLERINGSTAMSRLTQQATRAARATRDVSNRARDATGRFTRLSRTNLQRINRQLAVMRRRLNANSLAAGGLTTLFAGLGTGLLLRGVIGTIANFEQAITNAGVVIRATEAEFQALNAEARRLGATTRFSAAEAAGAIEFLGRAGFSANEAISALEGTLALASVGGLGLAEAADFASNVLQGFNLNASEAGRVADVLAGASVRSNTSVRQLAQALSFVAPVASAVGFSVEETSAALGLLSDAGIQASRAGTGFRRVISSLANPTNEARDAARRAGIDIERLNPELLTAEELFTRFGDVTLDAATALEIFGDRGGPAALVLNRAASGASEGGKNMRDFTEALRNTTGEAQELATRMEDTLLGAFRSLRSATSEAILQTGDAGLTGTMRDLLDSLTGVVRVLTGTLDPLDENAERFKELAETLTTVAKTLGIVIGFLVSMSILRTVSNLLKFTASQVLLLGQTLTGIPAGFTKVKTTAIAAGTAFRSMGVAARFLTSSLGLIGLFFAAFEAGKFIVELVVEEFGLLNTQSELLTENTRKLAAEAPKNFGAFRDRVEQTRKELAELGNTSDEVQLQLEQLSAKVFTNQISVTDAVKALTEIKAEQEKANRDAAQLTRARTDLEIAEARKEAIEKNRLRVEELKEEIKVADQELEAKKEKEKEFTKVIRDEKAERTKLEKAAADASKTIAEQIADVRNKAFGVLPETTGVSENLTQELLELRAEFTKLQQTGGTEEQFSDLAEKAREFAGSIDEATDDVFIQIFRLQQLDAIQKQATESALEASRAQEALAREGLTKSRESVKAAKDEIKALRDEIKTLNAEGNINFQVQTEEAEQAIQRLKTEIEKLSGTTVTVTFDTQQTGNQALAEGGTAGFTRRFPGRLGGFGGGDRVKALLEPGEFVVNKRSTRAFLPLLQALNAGSKSLEGLLPRFQDGGAVASGLTAVGGPGRTDNATRPGSEVALNFQVDGNPLGRLRGSREEVYSVIEGLKDFQRNLRK